jgi:hypothetical protein
LRELAADLIDERRHLHLRRVVVSGIKQHAPAAVRPRWRP